MKMKGSKILSTLVVLLMVLSVVVVLNKFNIMEQANAISLGITPGVDDWGNATTENLVYDPSTFVTITMNTTGMPAGVYYLYKPSYNCSNSGTHSATKMDWFEQVIGENTLEVTLTVTTPGELKALSSKVKLDRAGLWAFSAVTPTIDGSSRASFASYFWVNTSEAYVINKPDDFAYGSAGSKTITVTESGTPVVCYIDLIDPNGDTVTHYYAASPAGQYIFGVDGNITMAGDYTIRAYRDLDWPGGSAYMYYYLDEADTHYTLPNSGFRGYHETYGNFFSPSLNATLDTTADHWNYSVCGPWDPPEKNATQEIFTVETGSLSNEAMNIVLTNTTTVYWGLQKRIDVNVTRADGTGITGGTILLRETSGSIYYNGTGTGSSGGIPLTKVWINETGKGNYSIEIPRVIPGNNYNWSILGNHSWYVYFVYDEYAGGEEEWNSTGTSENKFKITGTNPPVQLTITNDGDGALDNKINIPAYTPTSGITPVTTIAFSIYGTSISNNQGRAYYGDDVGEDWKNITVSGDILYPVNATTLTHSGGVNGDWTAKVTPTKPGGTITIKIDWPGSNNGTDSETINIINGSSVVCSVESFTIGAETTLTFTVKDVEGTLAPTANVYLWWEGASPVDEFNDTTGTGKTGNGKDGVYSRIITTTDQGTSAPKNMTVGVKDKNYGFWGYTKVKMDKNHNMNVTITPTTSYAGDPTEYDIAVGLLSGGHPVVDSRGDLHIMIYDENGDPVTDGDIVSGTWPITKQYSITGREIILAGGTYHLYAYNDSHDSQGHNATITVTKYIVESSPDVLAWLIDTDANITFQITPAGNGTLTLHNVSGTEAAVAGCTETVDIENGIGTIEGLNATTLGNITFSYQPAGGDDRPADAKKLLKVTTATASPSPATIYLGEPTTVTITVTHPATGAALKGIRVGLDHGLNLSTSVLSKLPKDSFTDANGQVQFAITADASGEITIYIKNETDPDNEFVITAKAKKPMEITTGVPAVNEGQTFTVEAKSGDVLITDVTVTIKFAGATNTTTTGRKTLTAPSVPTTVDYPITVTADGYTDAAATIKVVNVPTLYLTAPASVESGKEFDATAGGDDGNGNGILITLKDGSGNTILTGTTVGGKVTFTAPKVEKDTAYTLTAAKTGYTDATSVQITVKKAGGIPGFELVTLIAAIGVALILLRRRRN